MSRLVALTGTTGFIGRHLLKSLTSRGDRVRVLLRRPTEMPDGAASAVVVFSLGLSLFAGPLFAYTDAAAQQMITRDGYVKAVLPQEGP